MPRHRRTTRRVRRGFTLLELTVVVLLLGITAAIAAPRMFDAAGDARESSARQSLAVIRDAIEMFRTQNRTYPGQTAGENGLKGDLETVMRFPFPVCPVGNRNDNIHVDGSSNSLDAAGSQGWAYGKATGEFIINHDSYSAW